MYTGEFKGNELTKVVEGVLGRVGAMISWSKGAYKRENPNNIVVFNSNVIIEHKKTFLGIPYKKTYEKIWHGDLDVSKTEQKLRWLASKLGKVLYVLREMDGRFDNAEKPRISHFVYRTDGHDFVDIDYKALP